MPASAATAGFRWCWVKSSVRPRGDPFAERGGQDALEIGQRGADAGHGLTEAFGGQQPDDHRGGLVVGEHQGRQAIPRQQAIAWQCARARR